MGEFNRLQENEAIATSDVKRCDADFATITLGSTDGLNEALVALEDSIQASVATTDWSSISSKPTTLSGFGITDAVDGNGTANTLPKWNDSNTLTNSKFVDNGTTQSLNSTPSSVVQFQGETTLPIGAAFYNNHIGANNTSAITGVSQGVNTGPDNTGVTGTASGNPTKNVGTFGYASGASANNIGLYGYASGATYNYAAQLQDGTETVIGRFLKNITIDGKANWANITAEDVSGVLKVNGTTPLTANWNAGSYTITTNKVISSTDAAISGLTVGKGGGSVATNTSLGASALNKNTSGSSNTGTGSFSLFNNSTGTANTANGANSLYNNVSNYNTGLGATSMFDNTSGEKNTAVGYSSLRHCILTSENVAIGFETAVKTADGVTLNTAPAQSIFIGAKAVPLTASDTNQIVIGYDAEGYGSNTTTIGNVNITDVYLHGDLNLPTATAVTTATITQTKYIPIVINGTTYKLLLGN